MDRVKEASHLLKSVFSSRIIQGMTGRHGLGVACGHIKALAPFL